MGALVRMKPKPHEEMKIGKAARAPRGPWFWTFPITRSPTCGSRPNLTRCSSLARRESGFR